MGKALDITPLCGPRKWHNPLKINDFNKERAILVPIVAFDLQSSLVGVFVSSSLSISIYNSLAGFTQGDAKSTERRSDLPPWGRRIREQRLILLDARMVARHLWRWNENSR
jgi:hypothetical protein